ncbi:glutaminase A [Legionella sp. W05-934-2]|jgi:glutaminase|uniref:glutaminase A n=1 Tax=Legionella sp. W05-934-2 TaxID=1198649 RepID=UPI0034621026
MATPKRITKATLINIVDSAAKLTSGNAANYIPELAHIDEDLIGIAIQQMEHKVLTYSNKPLPDVTLQSVAKLIPLIGLLEEVGLDQLLQWVGAEPSGDEFSSITRLEQFGPKPSNPMLNAGAITLCSKIPGTGEQQFAWLERWVMQLFNHRLSINPLVFNSEKRTGDRNRSLAFLLKSHGIIDGPVPEILNVYFTLCSYEASLEQLVMLPSLLANQGFCPIRKTRIISKETARTTLSIMATCGLYDETGTHMVQTGLPAKSGVSGYIIAVMPGIAGIACYSPKVNAKGNSIRGRAMLQQLAQLFGWHFAAR